MNANLTTKELWTECAKRTAGSLKRVVLWLVRWLKRDAWLLWLCGICIAAGWHWWEWQWWLATVPMIFFVTWWYERK